MRVKIKVKPEDFQVEEEAALPIKDRGDFVLYRLKKKGWNTVELLRLLSRRLKIAPGSFAYGGRKDRHGLSSQYITIRSGEGLPLSLKEEDYSLEPIGFMERPMGPDLIKENRFHITIRGLQGKYAGNLLRQAEIAQKEGYPNYFDDQRFGSLDKEQGFIAEKILKGHLNGALKIYLTSIYKGNNRPFRDRRRFLSEHWGDWQRCLEASPGGFEKYAFACLLRDPKGFVPLLCAIPKEEMSMFFSAYQSYLWNEVLRRMILSLFSSVNVQDYPGLAGDYVFYDRLNKEGRGYLLPLAIPMLGRSMKIPQGPCKDIYSQVLSERGITPALFNKIKVRQVFFKPFDRQAIIVPSDFSFSQEKDELYRGKVKLNLEFSSPSGSYATILVKRMCVFSRTQN
ncbi:MAG: tRNA pseudouridine(13) synthase TruD [Candidatus Omnitrophota bacterium]